MTPLSVAIILTLAVAVGTCAALLTPRARREDRDE